jgi:ribose transport system substrate-binding protein
MNKATKLLAVFGVFLLLVGVSSGLAIAKQVTIAYVTNGPYEFWTYAHAGCLKAEKDLGVKVEFYKPAMAQAEEQKRFIETMLAKKVDGLAISVIDPDNQTPFLNEVAAEIPIVMFDSDAPTSNRRAYIGMSNYAAGRIAGEAIKHELPDGGELVIFVGRLDAQNAIERRQGIIDELQGKPYQAQYPGQMTPQGKVECGNWIILDTRTDGGDESRAKANAEDILVKYSELDLMIGLWSYNTPAIITAVKDAGKFGKMKIVAFDEDPVVLQAIKDGHVYATIVQNPFEYGRTSVDVLVKLVKGEDAGIPADKLVDVPARLITTDKVDAFWASLKEQLAIGKAAEE